MTGRGLIFEQPKSSRSRRTILLAARVVAALRAHEIAQRLEKIEAGPRWEPHDLVFCQPTGRPIDRRADYRNWAALLAEAGVRHVRLHDARHGVATTLLGEGVPARVVADLLGHSTTQVTLDTYSHVLPALARDASERMSAALFDASGQGSEPPHVDCGGAAGDWRRPRSKVVSTGFRRELQT